jgi:hypothetical protein
MVAIYNTTLSSDSLETGTGTALKGSVLPARHAPQSFFKEMPRSFYEDFAK